MVGLDLCLVGDSVFDAGQRGLCRRKRSALISVIVSDAFRPVYRGTIASSVVVLTIST